MKAVWSHADGFFYARENEGDDAAGSWNNIPYHSIFVSMLTALLLLVLAGIFVFLYFVFKNEGPHHH